MKLAKMRTLGVGIIAFLLLIMFATEALAADWPQFLGDPASQGVSAAKSAASGDNLRLRWDKNTGSTWDDVPGTPIVVGDYVYYYSSQYLRMLDLKTGDEVAAVQIYGEPVNQFFCDIAYGDGKIFVPCQVNNMNDGTGVEGCFLRVFDANTLEQLYVTESIGKGQMQSPVMYHDGYVVTGTYGSTSAYACFSVKDEDAAKSDEVKKAAWIITNIKAPRGFSFDGAAFVGDFCYFGTGQELFVVNYKTGAQQIFDIGEGYFICSTITYSPDTKRLYVAANHPDGGASVQSYTLTASGLPDKASRLEWASHTKGGGTQSSPVVYNGRLYIGGGGHTMGSAEPFHIIDAVNMQEIYSVPILTKGSAAITTAYPGKVYIYLVPYAPNKQDKSELWIISDSRGQTEPKYEVVEGIGQKQYCSQSVAIAADGSLLWYNDAGRLYCYENAEGAEKTAPAFKDIANHWAQKEITSLTGRGVLNGAGEGLFLPEGSVTRAEFAQILANMSGGRLDGVVEKIFTDVKDEWFAPAVNWLAYNNIVEKGGNFYPNEAITREDMSLMMYRYAQNVAKVNLPQTNAPVSFTDAAKIAANAAEAVGAMQRAGIINGIADGSGFRFAPGDGATRAEAAAMIYRLLPLLGESK